MSTNSTRHQPQDSREPSLDQESPYPRENYYGDTTDDEPAVRAGHSEFSKTAKAEWVAKQLLKDGVGRLDPIVLEQDPNACPIDCEAFDEAGECEHESWVLHDEETSAELSEPKHHVRELPTQQRTSDGLYRRRENEDCGHLVSGGAIPDRPTEQFLGIVEDWLQFLRQTNSEVVITDAERGRLLQRAREMKHSGEMHDVSILQSLIREDV